MVYAPDDHFLALIWRNRLTRRRRTVHRPYRYHSAV